MEDNFLNHIECWVTELINSGRVDFNETLGIYSISGKVTEHPNITVILGNEGEVSVAFTNIAHNNQLKYIYSAEKNHIVESELKEKIQELEKQLDKAKNAAD